MQKSLLVEEMTQNNTKRQQLITHSFIFRLILFLCLFVAVTFYSFLKPNEPDLLNLHPIMWILFIEASFAIIYLLKSKKTYSFSHYYNVFCTIMDVLLFGLLIINVSKPYSMTFYGSFLIPLFRSSTILKRRARKIFAIYTASVCFVVWALQNRPFAQQLGFFTPEILTFFYFL